MLELWEKSPDAQFSLTRPPDICYSNNAFFLRMNAGISPLSHDGRGAFFAKMLETTNSKILRTCKSSSCRSDNTGRNDKRYMKKIKWRRADIILIAALLAVGGIFAVVLLLTTSSGDKVNVRVAGTVTASYPLNQDASYWIDGVNGGRNLLVIEDGTARIEEASCPDGVCVHTGRVKRSGQSIVCLPNQVVVEILGENGNEPDDIDITVR